MFGRMMNESLGKIHFWITFIGVYAIFVPLHAMGMAGHAAPLCADLTEYEFLTNLMPGAMFVTYAAIITVVAQMFSCSISSGACSRARRPATIPGKRRPWNGLFRRRRRTITLRGNDPGGASRSVRVRRAGRAERLHHADGPGNRSDTLGAGPSSELRLEFEE